jgi:integrase
LASATETKTVAGDRKFDKATAKGLTLQYALYLEKEGYGSGSKYPSYIRALINSNCDIYDPESVKETIAKRKVKDGTKMLCCYAYDALAKMLGIKWEMPTYHQEKYIFFLPEETELDALINATKSQRLRTYLQTLKETWPDPSEALGIRWIDVDSNRNIIAINNPVKDHLPREIEVSPRLISMINNLPRISEYVFPMKYSTLHGCFKRLRKRVAYSIQNPRILSIKLTSFRHWGGTQLAWLSNGNTLFVKEKRGHNCVESTMKYIAKINWKINQDFEVVTANTDEDIKKCGEAGFQKYDERTVGATHVSYYRRPKRFGTMKI